MAFAKIESKIIYSDNADYTKPAIDSTITEVKTPASFYRHRAPVPQSTHSSPGAVIDLSSQYLNMTSPSVMQVVNRGAQELTVEYWSKISDLPHPAAGITFSGDRIKDETGSSTYFQNVKVGDILYSANAGNATNRKFYIVAEHPAEYPAQVKVSLYGTSMASHSADDTASFLHGVSCTHVLSAGQSLTVPARLMDVDLRAITGASSMGAQYNEIQLCSPDGAGEVEVIIF